MANLFRGAGHAQLYNKYRPTYPRELYDIILTYYKKRSDSYETLVDLGCGSGQNTISFAPYFNRVIGLDTSKNQVKLARQNKESAAETLTNVEYYTGFAEDLSRFAKASVDMITCAQSFHWFDVEKFYPEAKHVLKNGGVLAVFGYGNVKVESPEPNKVIQDFYNGTLKGYWDSRISHIDDHLEKFMPLPFADFTRIDTLSIERQMSIDDFIGYLSTWSAYQSYLEKHTDSPILNKLLKRLCDLYGTDQPGYTIIHIWWPIFLLMGRNIQEQS